MRPYDGIRVLDLTHVLAGPFCSYQLALLGADVIKIEAPDAPDMARGRGAASEFAAEGMGLNYQVQGANKRALALDLKRPQGREVFHRLADTADVVIQNYRNGALDALGLGAGQLVATRPQLICCAITGYGADGPWGEENAYDNVVQAASGLMATTRVDGAPVKTGASVVDYATGMTAAFAVASALHQRSRTGRGQLIDCAMLDVALMMMGPEIAAALYEGPKRETPREAGLGAYATQDGLLMLGAFNPRQNRRLWTLLDRADFAAIEDWPGLFGAADAMRAALTDILRTRTAQDWEVALAQVGVPARRVRTLEEALALDQVTGRGYLQRIAPEGGRGDPVITPTAPFRFAHDGPRLDRPPPPLGRDTDELLRELGVGEAELAQLRRERVVA